MADVRIETLQGRALLPVPARLRITVFRDFPYLYEGDDAYEAGHLRRPAVYQPVLDGGGGWVSLGRTFG